MVLISDLPDTGPKWAILKDPTLPNLYKTKFGYSRDYMFFKEVHKKWLEAFKIKETYCKLAVPDDLEDLNAQEVHLWVKINSLETLDGMMHYTVNRSEEVTTKPLFEPPYSKKRKSGKMACLYLPTMTGRPTKYGRLRF